MAKASTLHAPGTNSTPPDVARAGVEFAMLSDQGMVRRTNQDACGARVDLRAFVVCDGMGGAAGGEVASRMAVEEFLIDLERSSRPEPAHASVAGAIRAANAAVYRQAQKEPALHGMGTTLVSVWLGGSTLWLGHVGDSRCYRWRSGELQQLTEDHSLVEEQVKAGMLSRVEAGTSPMRNIITRAVGSQASVEAEIAEHDVEPGDLYLLASDGLTREMADDAIAAAVTAGGSLESICRRLVDAANARGGRDNITVLAVRVL